MNKKVITKKGKEIIKFIKSEIKIVSHFAEWYEDYKELKIVFNYQFYIYYYFEKDVLEYYDYKDDCTDMTKKFNNFIRKRKLKEIEYENKTGVYK